MIIPDFIRGLKSFFSNHKVECLVFFLALILRLILFSINFTHNDFQIVSTIRGDDGYFEISKSLVDGMGFGSTDAQGIFHSNPLRPPVWPYMIAFILLVFKSYWAVAVVEIVMGSLIPVIGMWVARLIFNNKRISIATGVLLAVEPNAIFLSFIFYTETSFTFFFLLSLVFLLRYLREATTRNIIWFSLLFSIAVLIKPTIQYLPIVIIVVLIFHSRKVLTKRVFIHAGLFVVLFFLVISPWLHRNYRVFGVWGMSAQPAFNLYVYLVPTVLAIHNGTDFKTEWTAFVRKDGFEEHTITLANSKYITSKAVDVLKKYPKELVISAVTTGITFFTHDGLLNIFGYAGVPVVNTFQKPALGMLVSNPIGFILSIKSSVNYSIAFIILARLGWFVVTILAFIGVFRALRNSGLQRTEILLSIIIVAYFAVTTAINGFGVNARFKIPVEVFIFTFAIYGLLGMLPRILSRFKKITNQ